MTETLVHVDGHRVTRLRFLRANVGAWVAQVDLEDDAELVGAVALHLGSRVLRGTVDPTATGTHGLQRRARIVAGGGGWGRVLERKGYHNDAGVKARLVAEDAARAAGEQLGAFVPVSERVGVDYVREARAASCALEDVLGGAPWWVDDEGITNAGPRPAVELDPASYQVLAYDPRERVATLAVDDPGAVPIGGILSEHLDAPQTVRELELTVTPEELRIRAWCGGGEATPGHLAGLFRGLVERATDGKLYGKYRYRVIRMSGARADLQAVRKGAGLPDLAGVSMWPGTAGVHAELSPSAEVLVEFIEGRRSMPIITAFAGADGKGFVPVSLTLGGESGPEVARKGDAVEVVLPPMVLVGTVTGVGPVTGTVSATLPKALGVITAGSSKVKAAS